MFKMQLSGTTILERKPSVHLHSINTVTKGSFEYKASVVVVAIVVSLHWAVDLDPVRSVSKSDLGSVGVGRRVILE